MQAREAFNVAQGYLARREHSAKELTDKLTQKGVDAALAKEVVSKLKEKGYQSDERYAECYVRHRAEKGYGPRHIAYSLKGKGVDEACYNGFLQQMDWLTLAVRTWQKKFNHLPQDLKEELKQKTFLTNRGFDNDTIKDVFVTIVN